MGLMGDGEIGVRGRGDLTLMEREAVEVGTARLSLGLAARAS